MEEINGTSVIMENCGDKSFKWNTLLWLSISVIFSPHSRYQLQATPCRCEIDLVRPTSQPLRRGRGEYPSWGRWRQRWCHFVQTQHHQCKLKIYYSGRKFPSHRYKLHRQRRYVSIYLAPHAQLQGTAIKWGCCHSERALVYPLCLAISCRMPCQGAAEGKECYVEAAATPPVMAEKGVGGEST